MEREVDAEKPTRLTPVASRGKNKPKMDRASAEAGARAVTSSLHPVLDMLAQQFGKPVLTPEENATARSAWADYIEMRGEIPMVGDNGPEAMLFLAYLGAVLKRVMP